MTPATAVPVTVPTGLDPGDQYRLVFVTSTTRDATSSAIADYNAFVTSVANTAPELVALGTTGTAIASTATVDAQDNTGTNPSNGAGVPIYLLNDTLIATGNVELWNNSIDNALGSDEQGNNFGNALVWTGSYSTGTAFPSRTLGDSDPLAGDSGSSNGSWMQSAFSPAATSHRLYAISGALTVVPEPGTAGLLALGLLAVGRARRMPK